MKLLRVAALGLAGLAVTGCATILRGTETDFQVASEPPGAMVKLSTGESCPATPCKIRRPRKEGFIAVVSMPGYKTSTTTIGHHWSKDGAVTGIVGNAILGGGIGIGVDAANGANQDLDPNPLMVKLEREGVEPAAAAPTPTADVAPVAPTAATPAAGS